MVDAIDRPDFFLGRLDQPAHAAGGVENEHHFDTVTLRRHRGVGIRVLNRLRLFHHREQGDAACGSEN
jgi:hypothetical protein